MRSISSLNCRTRYTSYNDDWETYCDESGAPYYYNVTTGESTWDMPATTALQAGQYSGDATYGEAWSAPITSAAQEPSQEEVQQPHDSAGMANGEAWGPPDISPGEHEVQSVRHSGQIMSDML